jgi:hypothetical protein
MFIYVFVLFSYHQFCNCCLLSTSGQLSARQNGTKKKEKEKDITPDAIVRQANETYPPIKTKLQKKSLLKLRKRGKTQRKESK